MRAWIGWLASVLRRKSPWTSQDPLPCGSLADVMSATVFVDGHAGTIGLRIRELLEPRRDLTVLEISEEHRKDIDARRELLNACLVAILCLPDEASIEAVSLIDNPQVRVIDGSTAFRVDFDWVYGLPELAPDQRAAIRTARRVSNPGCWATCVSLLTRPLVSEGLLPGDAALAIHGVSGYTGGGKTLIKKWESPTSGLRELPFEVPYALDKSHKHIPEIQLHGRLATEPYFCPAVGAFPRGMRVQIPLHACQLPGGVKAENIYQAYCSAYAEERFIRVAIDTECPPSDVGAFDPRACNGTNDVVIRVIAHPNGHVLLMAILDNLGKGASGAAVQSLNIMLGLEEDCGLTA